MQKDILLWQFIQKKLKNKQPIMLLLVVESSGSSPGRQGFKMAVTTDLSRHNREEGICGSIGGGIMEQKLVELAKDKLQKNDNLSFLKKQIHRKDTASNQSGMICSGEQTVLFKPLFTDDLKTVDKIIAALKKNTPSVFYVSSTVFSVSELQIDTFFSNKSRYLEGIYEERLGFKQQLFIIGGGHCSLALSELMSKMDFYITLFDDRDGLNTYENNLFAHKKFIVNYENIADFIPSGTNNYVVIMTLGYRSDELVLQQLMEKKLKYLGVLGSQAKADKIVGNLRKKGFSEAQIAALKMPIGLSIHSQTPMEIAVSIAAEIIKWKGID